ARLGSTRLPGKMLLRETGQSLIEHTHAAAVQAKRPDAVFVATDHPAIAEEVRRFGGTPIMTRSDHASGGDRVAEVAERTPGFDFFVNLQGDEPEIDPAAIDQAIDRLAADPEAQVATLATPLRDPARVRDPANVKVVFDNSGRALYFSRSVIPHPRRWDESLLAAEPPNFYQHLGVYAFRRQLLLQLSRLPAGRWEQLESLEQLRVLEQGRKIMIGVVPAATRGIDTPADYAAFVARRRAA
ncbi:MAG: 3-deoxy-manno-octulosonate cytidylyltransferase, partial [Planctomycetota bacterium]